MSKPIEDKNANVPVEIIKELLTPSEWRMVKQRFLILDLLDQGLTVRAIAERVGVGTDTVVRTIRKLDLSPKLREFIRKGGKTPSSKWVFGQIKEEE